MKILDHHQMSDFRSVLQMMPNEHCFAEPFIDGQRDLRIQKIGKHIRAFQRQGISGDWKTNTGSAIMDARALLITHSIGSLEDGWTPRGYGITRFRLRKFFSFFLCRRFLAYKESCKNFER